MARRKWLSLPSIDLAPLQQPRQFKIAGLMGAECVSRVTNCGSVFRCAHAGRASEFGELQFDTPDVFGPHLQQQTSRRFRRFQTRQRSLGQGRWSAIIHPGAKKGSLWFFPDNFFWIKNPLQNPDSFRRLRSWPDRLRDGNDTVYSGHAFSHNKGRGGAPQGSHAITSGVGESVCNCEHVQESSYFISRYESLWRTLSPP